MERLKAVKIALVIIGVFLVLGGWVIGPTGDVILIFPYWLYVLGFALMMGALYLHVLNHPRWKEP